MWIAPLLILLAAYDDSYRAGLLALSQNKLEEARVNLEAASQADPGSARVWVALAQTYWKLHELGKANESASKAEHFSNGDALLYPLLAYYYEESGQVLKSCDMKIAYAVAKPNDLTAPPEALECYLRAKSPERAIEAARHEASWSGRPEVRIRLASANVMLGDLARARDEYQTVIRMSPGEDSFRFQYANSLLQRQVFEEAVRVLEDSKRAIRGSAQIELALGAGYYGLRRFGDAAAAFERTIRLDPEIEQPYLFLGKMMDQISAKIPELIPIFQAYEKAHPDSYVGYLVHGKALVAGKPAEAEKLLRKASELNTRNPEPHYELGILLERGGRFAEAALELEAAATLAPNDATAHYHLARVYDRLGKPELALKERQRHKQLIAAEPALGKSR